MTNFTTCQTDDMAIMIMLSFHCATEYAVHQGNTIESIVETYGTEVGIVLAANPNLSNAEDINNAEAVNILTQVHTAQTEETMYQSALKYEVSLSALDSLNNDLPDANTIITGQVLKVPVHDPTDGYAHTVQPGDILLDIANVFGRSIESIIAANPRRSSSEDIYPSQTTDIPISTSARGQVSFRDICDM